MQIDGEILHAKFLARLNRFTILVSLKESKQVAYLPNPGRLKELLLPNAQLLIRRREAKHRKTILDALAVLSAEHWICIDSRIPNKVIGEALERGELPEFREFTWIVSEHNFGDSRFDFLLEGKKDCLLEVKGCTLVENQVALFPDAPTERGTRHLVELAEAVKTGYRSALLILVQRPDAKLFMPNDKTDSKFGMALRNAMRAGVEAIVMTSELKGRKIRLLKRIPIKI